MESDDSKKISGTQAGAEALIGYVFKLKAEVLALKAMLCEELGMEKAEFDEKFDAKFRAMYGVILESAENASPEIAARMLGEENPYEERGEDKG